ncbi:hypothetical protein GS393_02112 [Pseudomonas savastanoi pv. phaseolicola]|nr:hypothetical protein [Pseudomonas savastanoi pv. phaseolicola]
MKAEFSDAPERITRRGHRRGVQSLVACLAIGSFIGVSTLLWATRSEPDRRIASMESKAQVLNGEVDRDAVIRSNPTPLDTGPKPASRQTSFNDQNFIPTGAYNIVTFHHSPDNPPRVESPQKVKLTIVQQTPSMKDRACWPFRQGSIESRNCRLSVGLKHRD